MNNPNLHTRRTLMSLKKLITILIATVCIGSGVGTILAANIGSDSISVLQDGMHNILNVSYGQASLLYNIIMILVALIFARKYFATGTIISALLTGTFIDLVNYPLVAILTDISASFLLRLFLFLLGLLIYSLGLSILIGCKLGMYSLDSILTVLSNKTTIHYKHLRIATDFILTATGFLLGGVVGVGTIISIGLTGVLIDYLSKLFIRTT